MKRFYIFLTFLFFIGISFAHQDYSVKFSQPDNSTYQLNFKFENWNLEEITSDGVNYNKIQFSQNTVTQDKGFAELPFVSAAVQLPDNSNFDLRILSVEYEDIQLDNPLLPSRGMILRSEDIQAIPYKISAESLKDEFYPITAVRLDDPFIVRDVRGTNVRVFPFQWNAVTKTLRVYSQINVELKENDKVAVNPLLKKNKTIVKEAVGLYENMFINFSRTRSDLQIGEYGDILVVTTARDEEAIEPYIQWKKEKGYNVSKEVVETGTEPRNLIRQSYEANNNIMYVLLVGDYEDISCELASVPGINSSGPTDPMLGCVVGVDYYPDIAIGRFSAKSPEDVTIQVNKTIQYEKYPNMEPDWYETFIGVGSNEGPGDDNEYDYQHIQRIYDYRLNEFGYSIHRQNYGISASRNNMISYVNEGASTIAYCGHGVVNRFVTTGFTSTDAAKSTNGDKLPFVVAVACLTGSYNNSLQDCLGESFLKREGGGAIVAWMSSVEQPWNPPQRGQDYFYDLLTGGFNYNDYPNQSGISTTEQRTHWGSLTVNSLCLMLTESQEQEDVITVRTWITLGDPSLQLRTARPVIISSSANEVSVGGNFETTIRTSAGVPIENALVCISQDGVYKKGMTDADGKVSIEHDFTDGEVLLVASAFNTTSVYRTIPVEGQVGLDNSPVANEVFIYPNPVQETLFINAADIIRTVEIFDVTGKMVYNKAVNTKDIQIQISEACLNKGAYLVRLLSEKNTPVTKTIMIK